jgi:hypothetical protein
MADVIVQIMVEALAILGIAMVEIKQGQISKHFLLPTEWCSGKYLKTRIRKSEIEGSLKRLDRLIQEVLMASPVNVEVTHTVDDKATLMGTVATSDKVISGA